MIIRNRLLNLEANFKAVVNYNNNYQLHNQIKQID